MEKYTSSGSFGNGATDDFIEVEIFDEVSHAICDGHPEILDHPGHYRQWLTPSLAGVQVVCHQTVLDKIQQHAKFYARQEIGGILIGKFYRANDASYVEIHEYLPAPREGRGQSSASHITFTETIWAELLRDKDRNPTLNQMEIVGWFHSHPNWGTQPSSLDIDIQLEHFPYEWQVALIYDPQRHEGDFYLWDNQSLVTAPGFYEVFSRVKPEPVTNWRNYIALTQAQKAERLARAADARQTEESVSVSDELIGQVAGDNVGANHVPQAAQQSVPVSTASDRPYQAQISISRGDIFKNFLRRRSMEIILAALIVLLVPILGYLGYQSYLTSIESAALAAAHGNAAYYPQKFATGPTNYPSDFLLAEETQDFPIFINNIRLNTSDKQTRSVYTAPPDSVRIVNNYEEAYSSICAKDWRIGQSLEAGAIFLLRMELSGGYTAQTVYLKPTYQNAEEKLICFDGVGNSLQIGQWNGSVTVYMPPTDTAATSDRDLFLSLKPTFSVNVKDQSAESNEQS